MAGDNPTAAVRNRIRGLLLAVVGAIIAVAGCDDPAPDTPPGAVERNADRIISEEESNKQARVSEMDARARTRSEEATARVDAIEKERRKAK